MISDQAAREVNQLCSTAYKSRWTTGYGIMLFEEFEHLLDDKLYVKAVRLHLHDPDKGYNPPIPADIERQLRILVPKPAEPSPAVKRARSALFYDLAEWRKRRGELARVIYSQVEFPPPEPHQERERDVLRAVYSEWMRRGGNLSDAEAVAVASRALRDALSPGQVEGEEEHERE